MKEGIAAGDSEAIERYRRLLEKQRERYNRARAKTEIEHQTE